MRKSAGVLLAMGAAALLLTSSAPSSASGTSGTHARHANWVGAWAPSPVVGTPIPFSPDCPAGVGLTNQTVRNVAFLSVGGDSLRVRLTNTFGLTSMVIGHATVAAQAADANAVPGTVRTLTFGGHTQVTIAAGGHALSDPVPLRVPALSTVLISVYVPGPTGPVTMHPFTAQGNFLGTGDLSAAPTGAGYASLPCWMFVDGVDVDAPSRVTGSVVALGDSITDTAATTGNVNRRWPDDLARRFNSHHGPVLSVLNAGLGGDRLLEPRPDGDFWGVPGLARLERDVFSQAGVRDLILLEGVNDIGFSASAGDLISGYQQVIAQAHERGLRVFGGTVMPFGTSFVDTPERRQTWTTVNTWIRGGHGFDGVIDFAAATAAPGDPFLLNPAYDSGDHLHPNDAGCQAMADAVNLPRLLAG